MKLLHFLVLSVAMTAFFTSCDQNQQMPTAIEELTDATETETLPTTEPLHDIDYENLPFVESVVLEPSFYRIDPKRSRTSNNKLIYLSVQALAEEVPDCESTFTLNDKEFCYNHFVHIVLTPPPWATTTTGLPIYIPRRSVFVVEITKNLGIEIEDNGRVVNTLYAYEGRLIKNLTFPDIPIEVEVEE